MLGFDNDGVARLLEAASRVLTETRYCWLATSGAAGGFNARPMGFTRLLSDDDRWIVRFETDGRSRKVAEIARSDEVAIIVQRDAEDVYLCAAGKVLLRPRASEDGRLWRDAYSVYFRGQGERAHAVFLEIEIDRVEMWVRGVTPEPFGLKPTALERDAAGNWRLIGDRPAPA